MSKKLQQYFEEIELNIDRPAMGDLYVFVINEEVSIVSSVVSRVDNGFVLSLDKKALSILESIGYSLNEGKQYKEVYRINSMGKVNSPEGSTTVVPGDMIYIYMDPKYNTWNNIVLVKDDGKVVHDVDIESDGFKHIFADAVQVNESKLVENQTKMSDHIFANEPDVKVIKKLPVLGSPTLVNGKKLKEVRSIHSCSESKNYSRIWAHKLLCSVPVTKLFKK